MWLLCYASVKEWKLNGKILPEESSQFNESSIVISSSSKIPNGLSVSGILTIKGTSHPIDFEMLIDGSSWVSSLTFDRSKYNVKYGSGSFFKALGDKLILDTIKLETSLKF